MDIVLEYVGSAIILVFAVYLAYKHIISHPSDKYHNESWKERRNKNKQ